MGVLGVGGIVMFIPLMSTVRVKAGAAAPPTLRSPWCWLEPAHSSSAEAQLSVLVEGPGTEGFPAPAAGHRDTCQSKSSTGRPPAQWGQDRGPCPPTVPRGMFPLPVHHRSGVPGLGSAAAPAFGGA